MRLINAVLVIVDISGYTDFIVKREVSLLHAEQIISDLLEAMIDCAEHPLILNKLEGDAAFMYCDAGDALPAAVADALVQVGLLFGAFDQAVRRISEMRANCDCGACSRMADLRLKAFLHAGEVALKQIRQFEELAGEEVILIHRLLKNRVPGREYVLASEAITRAWAPAVALGREHRETFDGVGELALRVLAREDLPTR